MTPERIISDKLRRLQSQICCIKDSIPDLDEIIFLSVGLWFFNVDKDPGVLVHTATTMVVEVDYMTTDYCADLNNQINNAVPFNGKLKMVTVGATAPFNPIYKNSFVTNAIATC